MSPPKKIIRLQVTNCISLLVNLEAHCSFELFLIFQNAIIYTYSAIFDITFFIREMAIEGGGEASSLVKGNCF